MRVVEMTRMIRATTIPPGDPFFRPHAGDGVESALRDLDARAR
jgi:hypothetical protein